MNPFCTTRLNYKPENFFPRINKEYRDFVRKGFLLEEIRDEDKFSDSDYDEAAIEEPFNIESPSFQIEDSGDVKPLTRGHKFDVISFLSTHVDHLVRCVSHGYDNNYNNRCEFVNVGVEQSLKDKSYVLLVCVFVPVKWCELNARVLAQLSIVSSELFLRGDFEIVFVPVMRRIKPGFNSFYYGADAFHHFFTAFPNRLAVPVSSQRARHLICQKLNFKTELKTLLIGPNHEVLLCSGAYHIIDFGCAGYPFTLDRLAQLRKELPQLSLARLLGLDPTSRLRKFGTSEIVSIDHLSTKLVGLYLFRRGDKFRVINEAYQKCLDKDRSNGVEPQFEVVLACMPPHNTSIHPFVFQEEAHSILQELDLCNSWWVFPYDNSACQRLSQLSETRSCDVMIIVDPSTGLADHYGGEILECFGMDAYPFTRDALAQRYVHKAEQVTLQSLLCHETVDYLLKPDGQRMSVTELEGKYVVLYVDRELMPNFTFDLLHEWYHEIKEHHSEADFKFVFVPYKDFQDSPPTEVTQYEDVEWLIYPCNAGHSAMLRTHESFFMTADGKSVMHGLRPGAILAFGKDGYIHLLDGRKHIVHYGTEPDPFLPHFKDLRSQVIFKMRDRLDYMWGYK